MRRCAKILIAALLCCLFASGCGSSRSPHARVMNASPDSPPLRVFVGNVEIDDFLPFRAVSDYDRIDEGFNDVAVFASHTNDLLLEGTPFFAERQDHTIIVLDSVQFLDAVLLTDDNSPPAPNDFKLRFVHAAPSADAVDAYITAPNEDLGSAQPLFADVVFGGFAGYASLPQGTFQLRVTPAGSKNVIADTGTLGFAAGQVRTAVLVNPPGTATEPLDVVILRDVQ
jgi:Domain of unknown function (DUF4397)